MALHDLAKTKLSDGFPTYPGQFPLFQSHVWSLLKQQYGLPSVCKSYLHEIISRVRGAAITGQKGHAAILYSLLEKERVVPQTLW